MKMGWFSRILPLAILIIFAMVSLASASASLITYPKFHGQTSTGTPLSGGLVYTYAPGTSTPKATYSDSVLSVANVNPVVLDSNGDATIYFNSQYKVVLKTSVGVTVWTMDNVGGIESAWSGYEVDALNTYGGGTAYTQATIQAALTANGTTNKVTLLLRPGAWAINTPLAIPANVTFNMPPGAYFTFSGTGTLSGIKNNNVEWFGAKADSTTDCVASFKLAVAATATNGTLIIPANPTGYYKYDNAANGFSDATTIDRAMTIQVNGIVKSTGYAYQVNPAYIFNITGNNVVIEGSGTLKFIGTHDTGAASWDSLAGLVRVTGSNVRIKDITFDDQPQTAIYLYGAKGTKITDCTFTGGPVYAEVSADGNLCHFYILGVGADDTVISKNTFSMDSSGGSVRQGIYILGHYISITGNSFIGIHEHSIYCTSNHSIFNNNVIRYKQAASEQMGSAVKVLGHSNNVNGNIIYNAAKGGIGIFETQYSSVSNNRIYDFGMSAIIAGNYTAPGTVSYNIIDSNTLVARTDGETLQAGILFLGSDNFTDDSYGGKITNNIISNMTTTPIVAPIALYHLNTAKRMIGFDISDNTIVNCAGTYGMYFKYLHYSNIERNKILNITNGVQRGFYFDEPDTFNTIKDNKVYDFQAIPTLTVGIYYSGTGCTDNKAVGNEALGASGSNIWGYNAAARNSVDKNIIDITRGCPASINRVDVAANIAAGVSTTIPLAIPVGARIIRTQLRVDAALASGATWNAAFSGGSTQTIAHEESVAKNTKITVPFDGLDTAGTLAVQASWASPITTAVTNITITPHAGGSFKAQGTIRAIVDCEMSVTLGDIP